MIDIIFDRNDNNLFNNKEYDIETIEDVRCQTFDEYQKLAKQILIKHQNERNIVIKVISDEVLISKLALALFIEAVDDDKTDCVVFKVKDLQESIDKYKPYIALTIGIKYALRLIKEDVRTIYKDMETLNYLGLIIKRNYFDNTLSFSLENSSDPIQSIKTENITETIIWVAILKALSLAEIDVSLEVLCTNINYDEVEFNRDEMIATILKNVSKWIN